MPRVAYKPLDIVEPRDVVDAYRSRRVALKQNEGQLLNIDRTLLHSPAYAKGWLALISAVQDDLRVPVKLRQLAVCCVAILTKSGYSLERYHAPDAIRAGATQAQVEALWRIGTPQFDAGLFSDQEWAVLRLAREMTEGVEVGDETFEAAAAALGDDQQVVELVGIIASYNMLTRFLVALRVGQ
jgi:alkylhydroperoxidase family enzyme